jgi:hypothetical protein
MAADSIFLLKTNFAAFIPQENTPTERPPLVGEFTGNFCG